jgi:Rrf2 family protein
LKVLLMQDFQTAATVLKHRLPHSAKPHPRILPQRGISMISTKGRYALRMMLDLGEHDTGEYICLKDISMRQGITVKYLEQIVTALTKAGFLRSQRGNNGGYRLAKRPSEYKVGDILRVMEGSLAPIACLEDPVNQCERAAECQVLPFWKGLGDVVNKYVDSYTLQDLLDQANDLAGNDYTI